MVARVATSGARGAAAIAATSSASRTARVNLFRLPHLETHNSASHTWRLITPPPTPGDSYTPPPTPGGSSAAERPLTVRVDGGTCLGGAPNVPPRVARRCDRVEPPERVSAEAGFDGSEGGRRAARELLGGGERARQELGGGHDLVDEPTRERVGRQVR